MSPRARADIPDPSGDTTATFVLPRANPAAAGLRVAVTAGPDAGATYALEHRTALVGRGPAADVSLADPLVSSFHAEIASTPAGVRIVDLNSRNGTLYAGARIERAVIPSGATLEIGATLLRVDLDAPLDAPADALTTFGRLRGASPAMGELFATLARLARTDLAVLIEGATGTGKELAARALHDASARRAAPFVVLDCTAIPATLAESVLFGHEKGSFTGAHERQPGVFEAAHGGTVFLDEIGELSPALQPKLLRVLEAREVVRVGGWQPTRVDVRVLSATWRDVRAMINQGAFREDLFYRLAQARVTIPPLRDRPEDVPLLARHFLAARPADAPGARAISPEGVAALLRRDFAGNARELRSVVERAALMAAGSVVTPADLAFERMLAGEHPAAAPAPAAAPLGRFKEAKRTLVEEFERDYLRRLLERAGNNLSRAAGVAGVDRNYLRNLCRKHGLRSDDP